MRGVYLTFRKVLRQDGFVECEGGDLINLFANWAVMRLLLRM